MYMSTDVISTHCQVPRYLHVKSIIIMNIIDGFNCMFINAQHNGVITVLGVCVCITSLHVAKSMYIT